MQIRRRRLVLAGACLGIAGCSRPQEATQAPPARENRGDLAQMELQRAEQRGQLCSAANATGVGLRGEYFADEGWKGPTLLARIDGPVDFDRSLDWPAERSQQRPRSIRWTGWIKPPTSGKYRFHTGSAPGQVSIARQLLRGAGVPDDASVELAAGRFYPISVEIPDIEAMKDRVRLEWTAPHGSRFVVPRALLFLPTDSIGAIKT